METENQLELQLMAQKFEYDMKLKEAELGAQKSKEAEVEDRKDKRTKMQASQQSQMISQRQNESLPTNFDAPDDSDLSGFTI